MTATRTMPSENPDQPPILSQVTGYPRDRFEYTGELAARSELEATATLVNRAE